MSGRINLLYVIPSFGAGGTERLVSDLTEQLDPNRFAVSVSVQQDGLLGQVLAGRGYPVHVLAGTPNRPPSSPVGKLRALQRRAASLRSIVQREKIHIVHTHHLGPLLHAVLAGLGSRPWRLVHTEHIRPDVDVEYPRWIVSLGRRLFSSADMLTGVSDAVGAYFRTQGGAPPEQVRVIYNGVDVDRFAARLHDGAAKRRELRIPSQAWVIGLVASLRPQKNHALLLRALARLLPEVPEARLLLAGDGSLRESLESTAQDLGLRQRVYFLGSRSDIPELFSTFDVYCLPSRYEGLPLTLFEAMAAGKPVVATNVVGTCEAVTDGKTGLLVPPDDPDALAGALLRVRRDACLNQQLTEAGRRYAHTRAHLKDMVDQYAALYEQVLAGGNEQGDPGSPPSHRRGRPCNADNDQ